MSVKSIERRLFLKKALLMEGGFAPLQSWQNT
jgi:hypothetical protein